MEPTMLSNCRAAAAIALLAASATVGCAPTAGAGTPRPANDLPPLRRAGPGSPAAVPPQQEAPKNAGALEAVAFIEDDWPAALAKAQAEGKLLFVDVWAPWCHTCLAMRQNVLNRPELGRFAGAVVFAAIDSDRPGSADFLARYRVESWPTMFLIQPRSGAVLGMHAGSASLEELEALLAAGTEAGTTPAAVALAMGHAAFARGDMRRAVESYLWAQQSASISVRWQARLGAIRALYELDDFARCAELGTTDDEPPARSSAAIDFSFYAFECLSHLPAGTSASTAGPIRDRIGRLLDRPPEGASPDDLGDLYALGARVARAAGEAERARALEEQGLRLLEEAAARASTPLQAQVHDYARMNAYLALGRGEEAVKLLRARCGELPDRYEPYARLASGLEELGRKAEAIAPLRRAIELSYGPRRLRYLAKLALLLEATGDRAASLATIREEIAGWEGLPDGQRSEARLAEARSRLAAAEATPAHDRAFVPR